MTRILLTIAAIVVAAPALADEARPKPVGDVPLFHEEAAAAGIDYAGLCEAILASARLHSGIARSEPVPASAPRAAQEERELRLVKRAAG